MHWLATFLNQIELFQFSGLRPGQFLDLAAISRAVPRNTSVPEIRTKIAIKNRTRKVLRPAIE
jgi:hypothetical protein